MPRTRVAVLVVAHQAILRALYGYLTGHPREEVPHIDIPMHTVIALTPRAYGCDEERHLLGPAL